MRALLAMREWSTRRKVTAAAMLQMLWLSMLITAVITWDLSLSVSVAIAVWAGPALGGVAGAWAASKTSARPAAALVGGEGSRASPATDLGLGLVVATEARPGQDVSQVVERP